MNDEIAIPHPNLINGYAIMDTLGRGSFSKVCRCVNRAGDQFAMKIFPKDNIEDNGDRERFQREINTMAYIQHENLIALHDFFWDEDNFYLVIDYCDGGELFDYIIDNERLEEQHAKVLFRQIVEAIQCCHGYGVAHRDLKPENILIKKVDEKDQANYEKASNNIIVKVADFGLCGFINDEQLMRTFCGSPCYCSPECLCKVQYDGRKSDIWSLGIILFDMVTGEHPWNITNTSIMLKQILRGAFSVPPFVSDQCKDLLHKLIRVNPCERLSIEKILEHPWMRTSNSLFPKVSLPPLSNGGRRLSIKEITDLSSSMAGISERGIFPPQFHQKSTNQDLSEGKKLPNLYVRSSSVEYLMNAKKAETDLLKKRIVVPTHGMTMAQCRQRSAVNLLFQRKKPKVKPRITMVPITEE
ncbi:AGC family protein kinase [Tritrichomonas foetus]|uniref:AGC family protein kinase n=1 Tax=Tritrichomonas foetus TaxID=1144522 RepID=A0A1J4J5U8_9EUKA|nr:AGC family protein kinase [Tritrichomonas foetus]|eukprot:OHS92829.1 AGC family protein kinase [Tritrichomonas foetus]